MGVRRNADLVFFFLFFFLRHFQRKMTKEAKSINKLRSQNIAQNISRILTMIFENCSRVYDCYPYKLLLKLIARYDILKITYKE